MLDRFTRERSFANVPKKCSSCSINSPPSPLLNLNLPRWCVEPKLPSLVCCIFVLCRIVEQIIFVIVGQIVCGIAE